MSLLYTDSDTEGSGVGPAFKHYAETLSAEEFQQKVTTEIYGSCDIYEVDLTHSIRITVRVFDSRISLAGSKEVPDIIEILRHEALRIAMAEYYKLRRKYLANNPLDMYPPQSPLFDNDYMKSILSVAPNMFYSQPSYSNPVEDSVTGQEVIGIIQTMFPGFCKTKHACPVESCERVSVGHQLVMHLNDTHRYTFEQIADWLDTLDFDLSFPSETPTQKDA